MTKLFRFVSMLVVLVMVLGIFAAPMNGTNQVSAQKEVPTFVVAPTEIPTQEPVVEPTEPPVEEPEGEVPTEPVEEVTPVPTEAPEVVPLIEAAADVAVPGRYIVVFKDGVDKEAVRQSVLEKISGGAGKVAFEYRDAVDGLAAEFSPEVLRLLRQDPRIEFIEMDQKVTVHDEETPFSAQDVDTSPDSWGLDRIDQVLTSLDGNFYYPSSAGQGVHIYIIDTGIRNTHMNFDGRASLDFDAFNGSTLYGYDCDGHGTHVAGTAAGIFTGIARKASVHSVRVLDCSGSGYTSQIVAGIDWVAKHHVKPAVANMSLGGWKSPTEDLAVNRAIDKGVTFVVAAGNSDYNACYYSPARVPRAITVGATDQSDARASFSNYGSCVDVFAPGVDITSSIMESDGSFESGWAGTSMAAPHVTGVAALYLSANPAATPAQVTSYILFNAIPGIVTDPMGSSNRLLHIPTNLTRLPVLVQPVNSSVIADSSPVFKWKPVTNADQYYLKIASDPGFSTGVILVPEVSSPYEYYGTLADGVYYWKIIADNVDQSQEAASGAWKFTVDTTGPNAPTLTSPADGLPVNGIPTFKWLASPTAKAYRLAYDLDGSQDDVFEDTFNPTTYLYFKPASLPDTTDIYWYVQAKDALGNWGDWSAPRRVTINPLKPAAPKLLTPANNFSTNDQTPDFTWAGVLYGNVYQIQIARNTTFTNIAADYEAPGMTYTPDPALAEGKYYWRVRAKNTNPTNPYGYWAAYRTIVIDLTPPAAPNLTGPANGGNVTGTPFFTWSIPAGAKTYVLQFGNTPGFDATTIHYPGIKTNSYKPNPVLPVGDWFWRVLAIDAAGNAGVYGPARLVHVNPALPGKPSLVKPAQGSYTDQSTVEFEWTTANYADTYQIQFDNNSDFSSPNYLTESDPGEFTESINIGANLALGKWYWRVRGVNVNGGKGPWSAARYFTYSASYSTIFNEPFDMIGWTQNSGASWYVNTGEGYAYNDGTEDSSYTSSMYYSLQNLSNFSVDTRLKLDEGTDGSYGAYYGLVVRGTPNFNYWGDWTKGYYFGIEQYNGDPIGCFSVYKLYGYTWTLLGGFCDTAINGNGWNDLKVNATGSKLKFYINGYLMWQGTNIAYTSGKVGVFNYSFISCDDYDDDGYCDFIYGTPGRMYVDSFSFGAPVTTLSEELRVPDPALGVGEDPFAKKQKHE